MPMMSQNKENALRQTKEASFHSETSIILFDAHVFNIAFFINGKERRCSKQRMGLWGISIFISITLIGSRCRWPPCGWLPGSRSAWPRPRRTSPTSQNLASLTAALTSSEPVWWRRISSPSPPVTSSRLHRRARSWDSLCDLWRRSPVMTQTLLEIQKRDWKTQESAIFKL